jgi:hypothetical protein
MSATSLTRRPKLIYCAERHPAFDRDGFTRRWRQHARLGMSLPRWVNIHRYVHCDPIPIAIPPGVLAHACDGVALLWYRSEAARQRHVCDQDARAIMKRDEAETFARPVGAFSLLAEEIVFRPAPGSASTLFLLFTRRADVAPDRFVDFRRDVLGPRILGAIAAGGTRVGYVQNYPAPADHSPGLAVDGIDEISVEHPTALDPQALSAALANADGPSKAHVATVSGLWARPVVLHQADDAA